MNTVKKCKKCNKIKSLDNFYKQNDMKDGYRNECKECASKRVKDYNRKNFWKNRAHSLNSAKGRRTGVAGDIISSSKPISELDLQLLYDNNKKCTYCGIYLDKEDIVFDHKTPLCKNGEHNIENICICCKDCNNLKNTRTYEEFMTFINEYINRFQN